MPSLARDLTSKSHLASRGYLTQSRAAVHLGVTTKTLRRWTEAGVIERAHANGSTAWYYRYLDLERLRVARGEAALVPGTAPAIDDTGCTEVGP